MRRRGGFLRRGLFIGPQDFQRLARLQNVTVLLHFLGRAFRPIETVVELAIPGFGHRLLKAAFRKVAGEIPNGQGLRQGARLSDRIRAIFLGRLGVDRRGLWQFGGGRPRIGRALRDGVPQQKGRAETAQ